MYRLLSWVWMVPVVCVLSCSADAEEVSEPCEIWPCENAGSCVVVEDRAQCECPSGFGGLFCEINLDECAAEPCQNEGICLDGVNAFQCMCAPGYKGETCTEDIDECADEPCENGGICQDRVGSFECDCPDGFAGPQCEQNIDECAANPCENDGVCEDGINAYNCECLPGFEGVHCEINVDDCVAVVCENGGSCVDGVQSFQCACIDGYEGEFCEIAPYWDLPEGYSQIHFPEQAVDTDGQTDSLSIQLPDNSMSFTVLTEPASDDTYSGVVKLAHQTSILVKGYSTVWCVACSNRVYATTDVATALVPNSPDVNYKNKGKYSLGAAQHTVSVYEGMFYKVPVTDTPMDVRILVKHGSGDSLTGRLDLNLWFTEATGVTAAEGSENPRIVEMLATLDEILGSVGITVGTVAYYDVPAELPQTVTSTLGADSDLGVLFASTAGATPGTNIMFVDGIVKESLEKPTTGIVLGIAGGIPGPPFVVDGNSHSGVAISWPDTEAGSDLLGATAAHELGHYLGLFHSTEQEQEGTTLSGMHDPISDTPENDKTNLMWWASEGGVTLSPGQGFVLMRHPNVRIQQPDDKPLP